MSAAVPARCRAARQLVGVALLALIPASAATQREPPDSVIYVLSAASRFEVSTGKAGLFGFAGHDHRIRARVVTGQVIYRPRAPTASRVEIVVPADSLEVLTPPDTVEIRKVTEAMRTEVLHVASYPEIRFMSTAVTPTADRLLVQGALTLAGQTRDVSVTVAVTMSADTLRGTGTFSVKQTDFGIRPYRGGPAGTVRVADRVTFEFEALGVAQARP